MFRSKLFFEKKYQRELLFIAALSFNMEDIGVGMAVEVGMVVVEDSPLEVVVVEDSPS